MMLIKDLKALISDMPDDARVVTKAGANCFIDPTMVQRPILVITTPTREYLCTPVDMPLEIDEAIVPALVVS
jgi:hypothetical protein